MKTTFLGTLILAALIAGCANISDAIRAKDEGTVQTYPVDFEQGWNIARTVLRWEDAETIEEHKDERYMVTTVGANFVSAGSVVAVWVEPVKDKSSKVTIVTKRKIQTNIATGLTETTFHQRFAQAVELVRAGKSLPAEPPAQ